MKITFFTSLDEAKPYVLALNEPVGSETRWLGPIPTVGNDVLFRVHARFTFRLRVCSVTWMSRGAECQVELHMPPAHGSVREWMEWFKRHERES